MKTCFYTISTSAGQTLVPNRNSLQCLTHKTQTLRCARALLSVNYQYETSKALQHQENQPESPPFPQR